LTYKPPTYDGGAPITSYVIEMRDARRTNWSPVVTTDGPVLTCTAERLVENNEYFFRVSAVNQEGQGPALESADTVKPQRQAGKYSGSPVVRNNCTL